MALIDQGKCATGMMKKLKRGQPVSRKKQWSEERSMPVRIVCNTRQSVVPRQECREQCEKAASLYDRWVWRARGVAM